MILTGGHLPERGSGALRTPVGQAPGLSARSARGAAEARRSRGARSALAAATPQAPLTWEERPRTLRSAPEPTHGNSRSAGLGPDESQELVVGVA